MSAEPVDLVLHIGSGKTGTTSIQQLLRRNGGALADRGILFPRSPGRFRHVRLGLYATPDAALSHAPDWLRGNYPAPEVFRRRFRRRLLREIAESDAQSVVFSDEGLYISGDETVARLGGLLAEIARRVRLVVYLRRQDDHLVSRYQQVVKMGEVLRLAAWARKDFTRTYDYRQRLATWQALEPDRVVVRPFERERFVDGSLHQDFLDAAGLGVRADALTHIKTRNESLGAEAVEFLRLLNLHRIENLGAKPWQVKNQPYVARLGRAPTGPILTLPPDDLDRFMDRWAESNRAVAREFLRDAAGELFHTGRKTGNSTTEQSLDPARLDHYFELLEIPDEQQPAVRVLAEREAGPGR